MLARHISKTWFIGFSRFYVAEKAKIKNVKKYKMSDVSHWIYHPCWSEYYDGAECFLSIFQVLHQQDKFKKHMTRIENSDIDFPLIVVEDKYDKYGSILDGNHRFAKMILLKKRNVNVIYFTEKELKKLRIRL